MNNPPGDSTTAPAGTLVVTAPLSEKAGDRIGHYKLLQQIGEGGCGVVYMAEQEEPVRRRVALKVIKLGMDTRAVIGRFEAERQALALMDHPNIAKVLDAGATETGRPFFVMELVRGIKITEYCDQNKLSTRERLGLFIPLCHAIQHAHQKGVIHRDIKPSNILVTLHDGVPVPKVIDFGIAKATDQRLTDKTVFTQFEQFIGTPAYMSPEQAEMSGLDIDTRTDIYSLGVLLYELLTGKTPFDPKKLIESGLDGMRKTIRDQEPERPSTRLSTMVAGELTTTARHRRAEAPRLISSLRGDLDWIVMKALEKDRTRRYETANGLAMDVQHYLANEPVEARPPSKLYRFQKLMRRNKAAFIAGSAVTVALLAGFIVSFYLFLQEREARRRAVAAEQEQARLREKAEKTAELEARMRFQAEVGEKYSRAGMLLSEGKFDEAEQLMNQAIPLPVATPIYGLLASYHGRRGEWAAALTNYSRVIELASPTNSHYRDLLVEAYHGLAPLLLQIGDRPGYERHCARVLREFGTTSDPTTAERLAKDCLILPPPPGDLGLIATMAETALAGGPGHKLWPYFEFIKGLSEYRQGHYAGAVDWLQKTLQDQQDACRTLQAYMVLAMAQHQLGQQELARGALTDGLRLAQSKMAGSAPGDAGPWNDWIIAQLFLREAKALVGNASPVTDK